MYAFVISKLSRYASTSLIGLILYNFQLCSIDDHTCERLTEADTNSEHGRTIRCHHCRFPGEHDLKVYRTFADRC